MYKTVLITGASRGIGRAIACAFAREGCRLVINCSHSEKELLALADELRETCHVDVLTSIGDVSDYTYMEQLFSQSEARFGGVDILVNNAGISHIGLLEDMTIDEWNRIIGVNLTSVFSASKLALPHMIHQKSGKILNISSIWGNVGASCEVAYSACKGGINSFTRALAKELAPSSIQVNAIACGVIDTEMNACFSAEERAQLRRGDPRRALRRAGGSGIACRADYHRKRLPDRADHHPRRRLPLGAAAQAAGIPQGFLPASPAYSATSTIAVRGGTFNVFL